MKAANLQEPNPFPYNIIEFPKRPSREVKATRKLSTQIPRADGIENTKSVMTNIRQFRSPSTDIAHRLVSDARTILARSYGIYGALAIPNMDFARLTRSRRLALELNFCMSNLKASLAADEANQTAVT
jgi:hypothetical protein